MTDFHEWITRHMKRLGVEVQDIAEQFDVSRATIRRIINGEKYPNRGEIIALAYILHAEDEIPDLMEMCGYDDILTPFREHEKSAMRLQEAFGKIL